MRSKTLLIIPVLLLIALLAAACGSAPGASPTETPQASVEESHQEGETHGAAEGNGHGEQAGTAHVEEDHEGSEGSSGSHGSGHEGNANMAHVTLTEWSIAGEGGEPLAGLPSGEVMIEVHNDGKTIHRFAIWEGGQVTGDKVEGGTLVAETDYIQPGDVATLQVDLEPGEYILTCPVTGHTERGMHTEVAVKVPVE